MERFSSEHIAVAIARSETVSHDGHCLRCGFVSSVRFWILTKKGYVAIGRRAIPPPFPGSRQIAATPRRDGRGQSRRLTFGVHHDFIKGGDDKWPYGCRKMKLIRFCGRTYPSSCPGSTTHIEMNRRGTREPEPDSRPHSQVTNIWGEWFPANTSWA